MLETQNRHIFYGVLPLINVSNMSKLIEYCNEFCNKQYELRGEEIWETDEDGLTYQIDSEVPVMSALFKFYDGIKGDKAHLEKDYWHRGEVFIRTFLLENGNFEVYNEVKDKSVDELRAILTDKNYDWREYKSQYQDYQTNGDHYIYLVSEVVLN